MVSSRLARQAVAWGLLIAGSACEVEPDRFPDPPEAPPPADRAAFAGAEACVDCHADAYAAWSVSTHGRAGGPPESGIVVAPFDGTAIRFRDATATPLRKGEAWSFQVTWLGEDTSYPVSGVIGAGYMRGGGTQGFVTPWRDGSVRFLPFDWSVTDREWFCNTEGRLGTGWTPITPQISITDCADWPPRRILGSEARFQGCQGCHGSQIGVTFDRETGYHTEWTSLRVECESCHGPAADHVEWARDPAAEPGPELRDLAILDTEESLAVCDACHALKSQLGEGYLAGASGFEARFSRGFSILSEAPYTADGRVATFAYQGTHRSSSCYLDGNMSCVSCHEPHGQRYWDVNRKPLASPFDDGQCTACHGAKADSPSDHTLHPPESEGSRCVSCHMPYVQHPAVGDRVSFARSDHTIPIPRPLVDRAEGVEGACQGCHEEWDPAQLGASIEAGWGRTKPLRPLVDQAVQDRRSRPTTLAAATRAWLRPDLRDPVAQFTALARFLVLFVEPDGPLPFEATSALWALSEAADLDVRAMALAALHLSEGDHGTTRRRLATALGGEASHDLALRRRWVAALTFAGDQWREQEAPAKAEAAYRKGLELLPDQTYLLQAVGILHQAGGEPFLRAAVESDPVGALTRIPLALFQQAAGDAAGAAATLDTAVALNRWEPVTHHVYGRLLVQMEDLTGAIPFLERAVELDGANVRAMEDLMNAFVATQRLEDSQRIASRLLAFRPDHEGALRVTAGMGR